MLHRIPHAPEDPGLQAMARAVEACSRCGLCLPACPTFTATNRESESPRGRIDLMRMALEGTAAPRTVQPHLDTCLGCGSCETACPAQVPYSSLHLRFTARLRSQGRLSAPPPRVRSLLETALPHPGWFRFFAGLAGLTRPLHGLFPPAWRAALDFLPHRLPPRRDLPDAYAGRGRRRGRVFLLAGCVPSLLEPGVTAAAVDLLTRHGYDVLLPDSPVCCGALHASLAHPEAARRSASAFLDALPGDLDAVVSTSAFCGRALRNSPVLLAGSPHEDRAWTAAARVHDVLGFLAAIDTDPVPALPAPVRAAWHTPCHLRHGLGVTPPARSLFSRIEGLDLVDLDDAETCCGMAGTHAVDRPEMAKLLGRQLLRAVQRSGAGLLLSADPACASWIRLQADRLDTPLASLHPVEALARAYRSEPLTPAP